MKTFKELIQSGIAQPHYTSWGKGVACSQVCDPISTAYNNQYGLSNNTHMDVNKDGWCITGSFVSDRKAFEFFLNSKDFSNVEFPMTPAEFFANNNLKGFFGYQNGAIIYQLVKNEEPVKVEIEIEKED